MDNPQSFQESLKVALKKENKQPSIKSQLGKLPPQAIEAEEAVLGAVLLEKDSLEDVVDILNPSSFYKEENKEIYQAALEVAEDGKGVDTITVMTQLRDSGKLEFVGGAYYLSTLASKVGSAIHIKDHARIIKEKEIARGIITISSSAQLEAYEGEKDAFDLLDNIETDLEALNDLGSIKEPINMKQGFHLLRQEYDRLEVGSGVTSGLYELDSVTNGFEKGDLIILAARPSMGKTALSLEIAKNTAINGKGVAFFSLEMSETQLMQRLISNFEELPLSGIKKKNLSDLNLQKMLNTKISDLPIFIDDTFSQTVTQIKAKAKRLKRKHDIGLIMVDYLQLIKPSDRYKGSKVHEIGYISRALKGIAKDLDIPVVCLSQLSRAVESRGGLKKPMLSDLRESGDIEQDADVVMFLWRGEYYDILDDGAGNSTVGQAEIIIAKNRNGELATVISEFEGKYQRFK